MAALLAVAAAVSASPSSLECDLCVAAFAVAEQAANSTSLPALVAQLEGACARLFPDNSTASRRDCDKLAHLAAAELKKLPDLVTSGSGYPNRVVCAMLAKACVLPCCSAPNVPEQVFVTFGEEANSSMRVNWVTQVNSSSLVQWGTTADSLTNTAIGTTTTYTEGGWLGTLHHALLSPLAPNTRYYYKVGDGKAMSAVLSFVNPAHAYPMRVAMVGDMGVGTESAGTIARLSALVQSGAADWIFHVGDVAYADGNQMIWDAFGRQMQPLYSGVPYKTLPGNHEIAFNFAAYRHRYSMSSSDGMFWALDSGRVRFVGIDSEGELDVPDISAAQLAWLTAELAASSARKRAGQLDWIVAALHRPLYCSSDGTQCGKLALYLRVTLEELFQKHLVDIVFQAHAHNYERSTPVFNNQVMPASTAPVYVVNGIGGCREGNTGHFGSPAPAWRAVGFARQPSAPSDALFGYGILSVTASRLRFQMYSDNEAQPIDDFSISPRSQ